MTLPGGFLGGVWGDGSADERSGAAAVAAACGWPADLPEEEALARLLALNYERAAAQTVASAGFRDGLELRHRRTIHSTVLAWLGPAIHETRHRSYRYSWMPGTRPGKTIGVRGEHLNASKH